MHRILEFWWTMQELGPCTCFGLPGPPSCESSWSPSSWGPGDPPPVVRPRAVELWELETPIASDDILQWGKTCILSSTRRPAQRTALDGRCINGAVCRPICLQSTQQYHMFSTFRLRRPILLLLLLFATSQVECGVSNTRAIGLLLVMSPIRTWVPYSGYLSLFFHLFYCTYFCAHGICSFQKLGF